jgi:hypothetical protein
MRKVILAAVAAFALAGCTPAGNSLYHGVWGFHLNQVDGKPCALGFSAGVGIAADEPPAPPVVVVADAPPVTAVPQRKQLDK